MKRKHLPIEDASNSVQSNFLNKSIVMEDNVTVRRRQFQKTKSLESINSLSSTASDNILTKSLDLSTNRYSACIDEMKVEIGNLKSSLLCTQNELENIILENVDLKKQISQLNKDIDVLKQICSSPVTSIRQKNMSSSTKKTIRRRLAESFQTTPSHFFFPFT